ncbi:hypothetical protein BASA81_001186 [Batrachochytrium salamandrivorans]|nr:hypothetical protein BASA81_001186 [Batrachochytrium salamandrivorans]
MPITDEFVFGELLGEGAFSKVFEGTSKAEPGKRFAIKVLDKTKLGIKDVAAVDNEIAILKSVDHPNILRLICHYHEDDKVFLVTELCEEFYSERDAQAVLRSVASALKLLHSKKIVHRDLKPENILLQTMEEDSPIKLADFGFAKQLNEEYLKTGLGTPNYIAPEILTRQPYNEKVDVWSFGVIMYVLLCGYPPFYEDEHASLFDKIKAGKFAFDSPYWDSISAEAKDLVTQLLVLDPSGRLSIEQALEHPFLSNTVAENDITPVVSELRNTFERRKFKRAVNAAIAVGRLYTILGKAKE